MTHIMLEESFVKWLRFANSGMLHGGNLHCFDYALKHLPSDAPILEIGSFCGLSTNAIGYFKAKHQRRNKLITCDKWVFEGAGQPDGSKRVGESSILHGEYKQFVKETYLRNVRFFSREDLPSTVEMFSDEFFEAWERRESMEDVFGNTIDLGGPISFAYIDGNHTYPFAKRDFLNCDKHLVVDGFLLFDDSSDSSPFGVNQLMKEIVDSGRYELVIKNPHYLFKKTSVDRRPEPV